MSEVQPLSTQLESMLQKAQRSLISAQRQVIEEDFDFALSRAYYAAFYAIQAVLLTKSLLPAKHAGLIRVFSQHFIKTGIFPKEFSNFVSQLFRDRQIGDYRFDLDITKDYAQQNIQIAEKIVEAIRAYLIREQFLDPADEDDA